MTPTSSREARARALAEKLWGSDCRRNIESWIESRYEAILAFAEAERTAALEEAADLADKFGTLTKPTEFGLLFDTGWTSAALNIRDRLRSPKETQG